MSKVLSFSTRLTEMDLISSAERKVNSTLSSPEPTGWAIFMAGDVLMERERERVAAEGGRDGQS